MENYPWYTIAAGATLQQGDFIDLCPVLIPTGEIPEEPQQPDHKSLINIQTYNVVVMSQSCDLENQKLDLVLVCPHWPLEDFAQRNDYFKSKQGKQQLRQGNVPGYHLLRSCEIEEWQRNPRVVDFRNVYSLPYPFVTHLADKRGQRLRLLPPYREHLSQAFARFFMRVGLPVPLTRELQ